MYCPQVFEDVVDILDPEMNLASEDEDEEDAYYGDADDDPDSQSQTTTQPGLGPHDLDSERGDEKVEE